MQKARYCIAIIKSVCSPRFNSKKRAQCYMHASKWCRQRIDAKLCVGLCVHVTAFWKAYFSYHHHHQLRILPLFGTALPRISVFITSRSHEFFQQILHLQVLVWNLLGLCLSSLWNHDTENHTEFFHTEKTRKSYMYWKIFTKENTLTITLKYFSLLFKYPEITLKNFQCYSFLLFPGFSALL